MVFEPIFLLDSHASAHSGTLTIVAVGLGSAPVAGETLADVAKKEEERRKTAKPADKTYTNKDLGTLRPGTPPSNAGQAGRLGRRSRQGNREAG